MRIFKDFSFFLAMLAVTLTFGVCLGINLRSSYLEGGLNLGKLIYGDLATILVNVVFVASVVITILNNLKNLRRQ